MAMNILAVGLGGAIGAIARYLIGLIPVHETMTFPVKTFIINIIGCALIALISLMTAKNDHLILFLKVGICGGFTTFSTFALESSNLMKGGHPAMAVLYMLFSVLIGTGVIFLIQYLSNNG